MDKIEPKPCVLHIQRVFHRQRRLQPGVTSQTESAFWFLPFSPSQAPRFLCAYPTNPSTSPTAENSYYSKLDNLLAHVAFSATLRTTQAFISHACGTRHRQRVFPVRARADDGAPPLALSACYKARALANVTILQSG